MHANPPVSVLMIEDDCDNATAIKLALEWLGFEVVCVDGGQPALALLELYTPDVILLDLVMAHMDGWEFLFMYQGPVPVVVYSAYADTSDLPRQPYAFILKPASIREVVAPVLVEAAYWRRPEGDLS